MSENLDDLRAWTGRTEARVDIITAAPQAALSATLDRDDPAPQPGTEVPPLWHWLYFTPVTPAHDIGPDGHAKRGGFLPPVPLPRRMWAGGRLAFTDPLRVGDIAARTSRIADVNVKSCGREERADTGRRFALWARDHEGWLAMQATVEVEN